jgi:hypothetical protein
MPKVKSRKGSTVTFSVSVDAETKAALRALADAEFDGNLSALVKDLAAEARRRQAAGHYLRRHGISKLGAAEAARLSAEVDAEVDVARKSAKRKKRSAA